MKSFLNKVLIQQNESLYSFLHRSIRVNYHDKLESVIKGGQFTFNNYLDETSVWFQEINELTRKGMRENPFRFSLNQFNTLFFNEKILTKKQRSIVYHLKKTKFCPQCLVENFYHRLFWDISLITTCTVHKQFLTDKCCICDRKIRLSWLMRNQCPCGNVYTNTKAKQEPMEEHLKSQEVIQRFLLDPQYKVNLESNSHLNAKEFFSLYFLFSRLIHNISTKNLLFENWNLKTEKIFLEGKNGGNNDLELMTIIVTAVYQLIIYPFQKLPLLMAGIDDVQYNSNIKAVRTRKYNILKDIISHPKGSRYHDAYSKYVSELDDEYTNDRKIIKHKPLEKQYVPVNEAIKLLKTSCMNFNELQKDGIIKVKRTVKRGRQVMLVDRTSIDAYQKMQSEIWTITDVCEYLGVGHRIAQQLIDYEFITPSVKSSLDDSFTKRFDKKQIEEFLRTLLKSLVILKHPNDGWIPMQKAMYLIRKSLPDPDYGTILLEIKQGRLKAAIFEDKMNLAGLYISKSDIERYNKIQKQLRVNHLGCIPREVQKIFRCGMPKVNKLIDTGILTVTRVIKNNNGTITTYLSKESIEQYLMNQKGWSREEVNDYIKQKIIL